MSVSLLGRSIIKVVTPEGDEVTDPNEIFAFIQNIDSNVINYYSNGLLPKDFKTQNSIFSPIGKVILFWDDVSNL